MAHVRSSLAATFAALLVFMPIAASAQSFLDRARDAVKDAGHAVEDAAKDAGRSVRDFLTDNPDLNRDIVDFGEQVGIPGFEGARPVLGPKIKLSVAEGIAGSELVVVADGLPGDTGISIAAGPNAGDTRQLAATTTDKRGEVIATVKVPDAPEDTDRLVFIVETADGRVRLTSEPFRVAPDSAAVIVTGTLSKEGVECPALRGDDGKLYTLTPQTELGGFGPGDRITIKGTVAEMSTCMQGITVLVTSVSKVE